MPPAMEVQSPTRLHPGTKLISIANINGTSVSAVLKAEICVAVGSWCHDFIAIASGVFWWFHGAERAAQLPRSWKPVQPPVISCAPPPLSLESAARTAGRGSQSEPKSTAVDSPSSSAGRHTWTTWAVYYASFLISESIASNPTARWAASEGRPLGYLPRLVSGECPTSAAPGLTLITQQDALEAERRIEAE